MKDTITIVIETGNPAFVDDFGAELAHVLRGLAGQAETCTGIGDMIGNTERDSNGNRVAEVFGALRGVPSVS